MSKEIVYEDDHLLVLDKPAGISVTPGPGHLFENTVAGWLLNHVGDELLAVGQEDRWGIVHRLDKDTSGVLVTAKTAGMYEHLILQFRESLVTKEYLTMVWGKVSNTVSHKVQKKHHSLFINQTEFVINAPIARHPKGISRFIVDHEGKPSLTAFTIVQEQEIALTEGKQWVTLLKAFPKTGRTHQIRVHLKEFGHPIVGDTVYQTKAQKFMSRNLLDRQFLHAHALECQLLDGKNKRFEAELPEELRVMLNKIGL